MNTKQQAISVLLLTSLIVWGCRSTPSTISGQIMGVDGPIEGAEVSLKSFQDEACVEVGKSTDGLSEEDSKKLDECTSEAATIFSNSKGQYEFVDVAPGWYSISISWDAATNPGSQLNDKAGNFDVLPLSINGRYFIGAYGREIFYFSGTETVTKDLDLK